MHSRPVPLACQGQGYHQAGIATAERKVERSHRPDQEEFYQLLTYKDDIDLEANLDEWRRFYNLSEASWCLQRRDPYEVLRERL